MRTRARNSYKVKKEKVFGFELPQSIKMKPLRQPETIEIMVDVRRFRSINSKKKYPRFKCSVVHLVKSEERYVILKPYESIIKVSYNLLIITQSNKELKIVHADLPVRIVITT